MTRPGQTRVTRDDGATAFVQDKVAHIRSDVDQRFKKALMEACAKDGNKVAWHFFHQAIHAGPSRGGAAEAMQYFGAELQTKLALTAEIIDAIEIAANGFKKWLELTGYGNDLTMIKGFVEWAEFKNGRGRVMSDIYKPRHRYI